MIKAQLFVLGTERELLSTDLECYRTQNATTGRPGPIPMGGLVTLTFVSGAGDDRLLYGFPHSSEGELCILTTAKIVFYAGDWDGVVLFEYRLKDAAFVYWKEEFSATGEMPMTVTLVISAAILEIKGVAWVKPWRESEVFSEEGVVCEKEGQEVVSDDRGEKEEDGGVLREVILEGAKGGSTKLLGHGRVTANWGKFFNYRHGGQMSAIEHIMYRHAHHSDFANVSRFSQGTSAKMIKGYVDQAIKCGKPIQGGFEYNLGRTIGTGMNGSSSSTIRVFIRDGWVRTAFPVH